MDNSEQARVFGRYILGRQPSAQVIALYKAAMAANQGSQERREQKIVMFAQEHPWSIGLLDSGLALTEPHAELRRRLYVMFSILESMPQYHDYFLPKKRSPWFSVAIVGAGIRGVCKAALGVLLVRVVA